MSHFMDESRQTLWMSHVTRYGRVMTNGLHTLTGMQTLENTNSWRSHVTLYGRVLSHIIDESCHTFWTGHDWNADFG